MTREIPLTKGAVAIVDDEDYERLSAYRWHLAGRRYAARTVKRGGRTSKIWMHREIIGAADDAIVDHRDGDGLHNCRVNLREATVQQNTVNRRVALGAATGYRGVYRQANARTFRAHLTFEGAFVHIGSFRIAAAAARAYDVAATERFGEFAVLNFSHQRDWLFPHEHVGIWPPQAPG